MNLETQVKHYNEAYRNGNALISDKKFDELEKKLFSLKPESDYFKQKLVLPSIEKDTIENFITGLDKDEDIVVEPKIDGCAVAIEYRDGILHKAITRKGKDITRKMTNVHSVPLSVPTKDTIQIRGELYTKDVAGNVSQRIAAGYLRSKSFIPNVNLKFCAFQIINAEINQWDALSMLLKLGFHAIRGYSKVPAWSLKEEHKYLYKNNFPTDGIVLKINDYKLQQTRPCNWQIAIKHL